MKKETAKTPDAIKPESVAQPDEATGAEVEQPEQEQPEATPQDEIRAAAAEAAEALNKLTATLDKHGYNVWNWGQIFSGGFISCRVDKETMQTAFAPGNFSGADIFKRAEPTPDEETEQEAPQEAPRHQDPPLTRIINRNGKDGGRWINKHYAQG